MVNEMVNEKHVISILDVDFFVHLGIPEQYEDLLYWQKLLASVKHINTKSCEFTNICCMAGDGNRMKNVSVEPKPFIKIDSLPMYEHVLNQFSCKQNIIITNELIASKIKSTEYQLEDIGKSTRSQIESLIKLASNLLTLFISNLP